MKYIVLVQHFGDKQYFKGDSREISNKSIAGELIKAGLIVPENEYVAPPPPTPKPKKDKCNKNKKNKQDPEPPAEPPTESPLTPPPTEPQDGTDGQGTGVVAPPLEIEEEE